MRLWIGIVLFAVFTVCGLGFQSVPAQAGDRETPLNVDKKDARRQEWMRIKWEKLIARARAQQQQINRWHDARLKHLKTVKRKVVTEKKRQIAAELGH